ncbi:selenium cofactor biosynthesis protein YqeC [Desulfosporosinus sp. Sb-LF]|uniref:selenium cofactor biosynthesis protein YqeC n=1 Tax=Desulfosporosinus sp. Sb-LF TaxID=2560027 RepID=UPI00107EF15F|nr:selenium cofactor biosynthesis protein YqeC [Desulfosporosinus sp. Sb-LF]TGE34570.1 putative selenium-dependent hydroxylase accessory protein YqeC [Desulfosporosinus sp. Sb-LF]
MVSSLTGPTSDWASGGLWDMTERVQVITFIGAGGKTTCLRSITQEIESAGQLVIATTTTKVFPEKHFKAWRNLLPPLQDQENACFWYAKVEDESGKWVGPSIKMVNDALARDLLSIPKRFWVIEGDGARERKLKCWGPHEPQIPMFTKCAVLVVDRGLWGEILQETQVHRPERCQGLLGQVWNAENAWSYFLKSPVFAPRYGHLSWVILLNSPDECAENKESMSPKDLQELCHRWVGIRQDLDEQNHRPKHLRLAAGDAKGEKLQWFDLW